MVSKEEALRNYVSLIRCLIVGCESIVYRIYNTPCIYYKSKDFFNEKDPFKIMLQWNMFYRKNIKSFSNYGIKESIKTINKFSQKNKIDISDLAADLDYFKSISEKYDFMYKNIKFIENIDELDVNSTVSETLDIFNKLRYIEYHNLNFIDDLDLDFEKKFYQTNLLKKEASYIYRKYPDTLFCRTINLEVSEYTLNIIN